MTFQVFNDLYEPCPKYSCFTSLVSALFNATACSAFTFFLCRTSSMSSVSFGSIPSLSRNSSFSISVSFTLISNLLTWLVKSSMFLRCGNKNQNSLLIHIQISSQIVLQLDLVCKGSQRSQHKTYEVTCNCQSQFNVTSVLSVCYSIKRKISL